MSKVVLSQRVDPSAPEEHQHAALTKTITNLMGRCERVLMPLMPLGTLTADLRDFMTRVRAAEFYVTGASRARLVDWDAFEAALWDAVCTARGEGPELAQFPMKVLEDLAAERYFQEEDERQNLSKERLSSLLRRNGQPQFPGKWHKEPYNPRSYKVLTEYTITPSLATSEVGPFMQQFDTPLNGFLGQAYNYDDHGLTEEWMVSFRDSKMEEVRDDDVIRTQVASLLDILGGQVQDRVCNELQVLADEPANLRSGTLAERPVWGIDCFTRRNIEIAIEDRAPKELFNAAAMAAFIDRTVLPSINAQPTNTAHNMAKLVVYLLTPGPNGVAPVDMTSSPVISRAYALALQDAISEFGLDMFKIHPKGTGVICTAPEGIQPHVLIAEYLGEVYPPFRWCERLDVVEQAQAEFGLKPALPEFYNILLERPRQDSGGYGLLWVDASQMANLGGSCSHSCHSNCTSAVVARNGKLTIALTTNRFVHPGEELCMDYSAMTTSDLEWRAAICLCGSAHCRGSFLHFATQDNLQQVLNQSCGSLSRYASLLRACSQRPFSSADQAALERHGIRSVVLGDAPAPWIPKFAADSLRFVEFERKALPCALLRHTRDPANSTHSLYTYGEADLDARSVMEQRLQSLVCCLSMVRRVLEAQPEGEGLAKPPLKPVPPSEASERVWMCLLPIPALITEHLLKPKIAAAAAAAALEGYGNSNVGKTKADSSPDVKGKKEPKRTSHGRVRKENVRLSELGDGSPKRVDAVAAPNGKHHRISREGTVDNGSGVGSEPAYSSSSSSSSFPSSSSSSSSSSSFSSSSSSASGTFVDEEAMEVTPDDASDKENATCESLVSVSVSVSASASVPVPLGVMGGVHVDVSLSASVSSATAVSADLTSAAAPRARGRSQIQAQAQLQGVVHQSQDQESAEKKSSPKTKPAGPTAVERLDDAIAAISALLTPAAKPKGLTGIRESCLSIRKILLTVEDLASTTARLGLLADLLALWAYTTNFSTAETYQPVESDQISVVARDLGTNVTQSKVVPKSQKEHEAKGQNKKAKKDLSSGGGAAAAENAAVPAASVAAPGPKKTKAGKTEDLVLDPNAVVHLGRKKYAPEFTFWQLIQWYKAGTDMPLEDVRMELFGCCQLPAPAACFGPAEAHYGVKARETLLKHISNERTQTMCWPDSIRLCFSGEVDAQHQRSKLPFKGEKETREERVAREKPKRTVYASTASGTHLFGSPMLDVALGALSSAKQAINEIGARLQVQTGRSDRFMAQITNQNKRAARLGNAAVGGGMAGMGDSEDAQFDNILPPELPTSWVQCDLCHKWRRVAWYVDADGLPDDWSCSQNTWEPEAANCDALQDQWDPEKESTVESKGATVDDAALVVGSWRDVYCIHNCVYYEGQIIEVKPGPPDASGNPTCPLLHFKFKGWTTKFNEWLPADHSRIQPHNLYTDPMSNCPRAQERWQGAKPVQVVLYGDRGGAEVAPGKGRGRKNKAPGAGANGGKKPRRSAADKSATATTAAAADEVIVMDVVSEVAATETAPLAVEGLNN